MKKLSFMLGLLALTVLFTGCSQKSTETNGFFSKINKHFKKHIKKQSQLIKRHSGKKVQHAKKYSKEELLQLLDSSDISGLDKCFQYVFDKDNKQIPKKYRGNSDYWDIEILKKVKALREAGKC